MNERHGKYFNASVFRNYLHRPAFPVMMKTSFFSRLSNRYLNTVDLQTPDAEEEPPIGYESSWAGIFPDRKE